MIVKLGWRHPRPPELPGHTPLVVSHASQFQMLAIVGEDVVVEVVGDLFSASPSTSLAHCISRDCKLGKGVAKLFRHKFGRVAELEEQHVPVGGVAVLREGDRFIYNLVTKEKYYDKPSIHTLKASLEELRRKVEESGVERVAMPRIGCGLDKLRWEDVRKLLVEVFTGSSATLEVFTLDASAPGGQSCEGLSG